MSCSTLYCLSVAIFLLLDLNPSLAACGDRPLKQLRLRSSTSNGEESESDQQLPPIDLSHLSEQQLQQLMQQLNVADQFDEDNRGSSRPWKKVQRIIRRQLVRVPKRYLKKLLRQFGLARSVSVRSGVIQLLPQPEVPDVEPQPQLYYLIPLE
ncbi:uncharacterized protein LOC133847803 [Drosophila sulfurigaster albostrigata]|uniref:Uncharacterized protein LOC117567709 n=1 Tax=Drosophila albomicans TaxID=7291 RepID=A0A6P8WLW4_DROAB|nr:uncharacterized protein LOC117567709 [Drosophila albomicans]XP_060662254.1 uncharacterized protein LOC132795515 [Drosophila nasuta]XP_062139018.1 uncharacterized protein LOC133847803 [Drosophila sulfurigaster albostrigata]